MQDENFSAAKKGPGGDYLSWRPPNGTYSECSNAVYPCSLSTFDDNPKITCADDAIDEEQDHLLFANTPVKHESKIEKSPSGICNAE